MGQLSYFFIIFAKLPNMGTSQTCLTLNKLSLYLHDTLHSSITHKLNYEEVFFAERRRPD